MDIARPDALSERRLEIGGPAMLSQKVAKRLIGQTLQIDASVARQKGESLQGLFVELNALAGHESCSNVPVIQIAA
jgi:hypothetical protein